MFVGVTFPASQKWYDGVQQGLCLNDPCRRYHILRAFSTLCPTGWAPRQCKTRLAIPPGQVSCNLARPELSQEHLPQPTTAHGAFTDLQMVLLSLSNMFVYTSALAQSPLEPLDAFHLPLTASGRGRFGQSLHQCQGIRTRRTGCSSARAFRLAT